MHKDVIKLLAQLMNNLQGPCSMALLGTAREPFGKLRERWNIHGWVTTEDTEQLIREAEVRIWEEHQ